MYLKRNSKLLAKANEHDYYVMIYHNTPVLYWNKLDNYVTLKHNNWHTMATACAMNYALEEIGCSLRVSFSKKENMLYLEGKKLENNTVVNYTELL